jgi:hypothetical protein
MKRLTFAIRSVLLATAYPLSAFGDQTPPKGSAQELGLEWFARLQSGHVDRTLLAPEYGKQLTDDAIKTLARYLKPYGDAHKIEVMLARTIGQQTFYEYKLYFDRGDTATMLIGYDKEGKVTGVTFPSMGQS